MNPHGRTGWKPRTFRARVFIERSASGRGWVWGCIANAKGGRFYEGPVSDTSLADVLKEYWRYLQARHYDTRLERKAVKR